VHTSGVIFAFGGNALFATSYYVVQRTCRFAFGMTSWPILPSGAISFHRHGGAGLCAGATQGKEYAEPEWYVDLWLTIVWVAYLLVF
jgi:cytochrome c oxidase cbb3-type subunit 1